jgi:hypothetical protein
MHVTVLIGQSLFDISLKLAYCVHECLYINFQRFHLFATAITTLRPVLIINEKLTAQYIHVC